jgi:hypothetical protein
VKIPDLDQEVILKNGFKRMIRHSCYNNSTYYEVEFFKDSFIRLKYEENTIKEKSLSEFEENAIWKFFKNLKFKVLRQFKKFHMRITPDVTIKI